MSDDPKKKGRQDRLTRRSREPHARGLCSSGGRRISQWQGVKPLGIGQEIEAGSWGPIHGSILFTGTASPSPRGSLRPRRQPNPFISSPITKTP
jgi:hypothetical protein